MSDAVINVSAAQTVVIVEGERIPVRVLPGEGAPGPAGAPGGDGADGAPGASAYEVAVANGFVGTESEWLASLQGPPGEDGADGTGTGDAMRAGGNAFTGDQTFADNVTIADAAQKGVNLYDGSFGGGRIRFFGPGGVGGSPIAFIACGYDGSGRLSLAGEDFRFWDINFTALRASIGPSGITVVDAAYGVGWDGDMSVPTKNALYDKIYSLEQLIVGAMRYQGVWNASTNSPAIPAAAAGNKGHYYKVGTAGSTAIDGISDWLIGDWIVSNGATWDKIDNTESVVSVAGLNGVISAAGLKTALSLVKGDVGLGNVDNTADADKPVSTAQQTALDGKAPARPTIAAINVDTAAADSHNNTHIVASGASKTLTLGSTPAAGTSFSVRFTTAWSLACAGGLSKNGASPTGVTTGSVAANSLITFLHEGSGVWVATGNGLS